MSFCSNCGNKIENEAKFCSFRILSSVFKDMVYNVKTVIRRKSRKMEEKHIIEEEKRVKEKWINDLNKGKQVTMGNSIIQCKSDVFIIDGYVFPIKEI